MPKLTDKQKEFVRQYLVDLNATQAAIRAGYSVKTAYRQGADLLQKTSIREAIEKAQAKRARRVEVTQDYVLSNLVEVVERTMQREQVTDEEGRGRVFGGIQIGHDDLGQHERGPGHADDISQVSGQAQSGGRVRHQADDGAQGQQGQTAKIIERAQGGQHTLPAGRNSTGHDDLGGKSPGRYTAHRPDAFPSGQGNA